MYIYVWFINKSAYFVDQKLETLLNVIKQVSIKLMTLFIWKKQSWGLGNIISAIFQWLPDPFQSFQNFNVQVASPFIIILTLGKLLNFSLPTLSHLFNGEW